MKGKGNKVHISATDKPMGMGVNAGPSGNMSNKKMGPHHTGHAGKSEKEFKIKNVPPAPNGGISQM